ncbi:hypothetical protein HBI27_155310 [Parastagonospora nodorum]|nr:hypothetical protein HBI27_155310 [Parastagonospora nodorum]
MLFRLPHLTILLNDSNPNWHSPQWTASICIYRKFYHTEWSIKFTPLYDLCYFSVHSLYFSTHILKMSGFPLFMGMMKAGHAVAQSSAPARSTSSPAGNTAANIPSKASHPTTPHANREIVQAFTMSTVTSSQDATPNYSSQPATSSPLRSSVQSVTMAPQGADKNQDTAPNRTQQTT